MVDDFYDAVMAWTTREATCTRPLLQEVAITPKHRVPALGCATATFALHLKRPPQSHEVLPYAKAL
jgi:hypothetical protein